MLPAERPSRQLEKTPSRSPSGSPSFYLMKPIGLPCVIALLLASTRLAYGLNVGEADAGRNLMLRCGEILVVELPSNPTTGYSWRMLPFQQGLLVQRGEASYESNPSSKGLVGAGGRETWKFRAVGNGSLKLTFSYARPWEKDVKPVRMIEWPVTIIPRGT